jgi:hypothetical protein
LQIGVVRRRAMTCRSMSEHPLPRPIVRVDPARALPASTGKRCLLRQAA